MADTGRLSEKKKTTTRGRGGGGEGKESSVQKSEQTRLAGNLGELSPMKKRHGKNQISQGCSKFQGKGAFP